MKIAVIGAGFVGLTTALGLCSKGHQVWVVDVNPTRTQSLMQGKVTFHEPGIEELLAETLKTGNFHATTSMAEAMSGAEVSLVCVGTPSTDKGIDLTYVQKATQDIAALLSSAAPFHVITIKSTVVPGSTDSSVRTTVEQATSLKAGIGFGLGMNPEFLREGSAVEDFMHPDRIVIGADDTRSTAILTSMYTGFSCPVITTSCRNAEMIKYAANSLLATLISFANEITTICETIPGLSEEVVMNGVLEDKRFWVEGNGGQRQRPAMVGNLRGGIGFGGSCFPKDVTALQRYSQNAGYPAPLLQAVLDINQQRAKAIISRLTTQLGGNLTGKHVTVVGTAFKPDTDDIRESPALRLITALHNAGAVVTVHDPVVTASAMKTATGLTLNQPATLQEALTMADGAIIATSWGEYKQADWQQLATVMAAPVIFDGRQVIPPAQREGFTYLQTGSSL